MFCDTQLNSQSRPNWCVDRVHFESLSSSGSTCMHQLGCAPSSQDIQLLALLYRVALIKHCGCGALPWQRH